MKTKAPKEQKPIDILRTRLEEATAIHSALIVLSWDQEVGMPKKAAEGRAKAIAHLSALAHQKALALDEGGLLTTLKKELDEKRIKGNDAVIVREAWRGYERDRRLPEEFVKEQAEVISLAGEVWKEAKAKSNFKLFQPWLAKIVDLKRREAAYIGYTDSPYDALLEEYEPGATTAEVTHVLSELRDFLVPFIKRTSAAQKRYQRTHLKGLFPKAKQEVFVRELVEGIGYDLQAGRINESEHPFSERAHAHDAYITVNYRERDIIFVAMAAIHEAGHALYELGLPQQHFSNALGQFISIAFHESQSCLWENYIGRSKEFWQHWYPKLKKHFGPQLQGVSLDMFHRALNTVHPGPVRLDADEVTYHLHIIMRFEIERDLIEGKIEVRDVPRVWNEKMKEYLGVVPASDAQGPLQDIHWSAGYFGYFPTYTLGILYSAMQWDTIREAIPQYRKRIASGDTQPILDWLRTNIHAHGQKYRSKELLKRATGNEFSARPFERYLEEKYTELYGDAAPRVAKKKKKSKQKVAA